MTKGIKKFNRIFNSVLSGALVLGVLFMVSCDSGSDDPPEPELYDMSGTYVFEEATLVSDIEKLVEDLGFPAAFASLIDEDITDQMAGGLLAEAPCDNPENGAVELKSNQELFFTCTGESNEAKAGTWATNTDRTELSLNLSVSSGNLLLKLNDLEINETTGTISGSITNFPITKDLLAGFLTGVPGADAILAGIPDDTVVLVDVDITFKKIE